MNCKEQGNYSAVETHYKPVSIDTCKNLTYRDFFTLYPILLHWESKIGHQKRTTGIFVGDILAGYSLSGIFPDQDKSYGEVAMIHIRPQLRGFGFGDQLGSMEYIHCMEQSPDYLKIRVADKTGKVEHFIQTHGFIPDSNNPAYKHYPVYVLPNKYFPSAMQTLNETLQRSSTASLSKEKYTKLMSTLYSLG